MRTCTHALAHAHVHTHTCTRTCTRTRTCMHMYMHVHIHMHSMPLCTCALAHACVHARVTYLFACHRMRAQAFGPCDTCRERQEWQVEAADDEEAHGVSTDTSDDMVTPREVREGRTSMYKWYRRWDLALEARTRGSHPHRRERGPTNGQRRSCAAPDIASLQENRTTTLHQTSTMTRAPHEYE